MQPSNFFCLGYIVFFKYKNECLIISFIEHVALKLLITKYNKKNSFYSYFTL